MECECKNPTGGNKLDTVANWAASFHCLCLVATRNGHQHSLGFRYFFYGSCATSLLFMSNLYTADGLLLCGNEEAVLQQLTTGRSFSPPHGLLQALGSLLSECGRLSLDVICRQLAPIAGI